MDEVQDELMNLANKHFGKSWSNAEAIVDRSYQREEDGSYTGFCILHVKISTEQNGTITSHETHGYAAASHPYEFIQAIEFAHKKAHSKAFIDCLRKFGIRQHKSKWTTCTATKEEVSNNPEQDQDAMEED